MRFLGTILIFVGIALIFFAMFFALQTFMQEKEPPQVFKGDEVFISDIMEVTGALENTAVEEVLPITKFLNIITAGIFVWLLLVGGSKLSIIGIAILKDVEARNSYN